MSKDNTAAENVKQKNSEKGLFIPIEILHDESLSFAEKLILARILWLDGKEGCYASNTYFARYFRVSPGYVSRMIKRLIAKRYITAEYERRGKEVVKRILTIGKGVLPIGTGGTSNWVTGYFQLGKENKDINKDIDVGEKNTPTPSSKRKKSKNTSTEEKKLHNDIKELIQDASARVFGEKYYHDGKEAGAVVQILKRVRSAPDPLGVVKNKLRLLALMASNPKSDFERKLTITPRTLLGMWNKLIEKKSEGLGDLRENFERGSK